MRIKKLIVVTLAISFTLSSFGMVSGNGGHEDPRGLKNVNSPFIEGTFSISKYKDSSGVYKAKIIADLTMEKLDGEGRLTCRTEPFVFEIGNLKPTPICSYGEEKLRIDFYSLPVIKESEIKDKFNIPDNKKLDIWELTVDPSKRDCANQDKSENSIGGKIIIQISN